MTDQSSDGIAVGKKTISAAAAARAVEAGVAAAAEIGMPSSIAVVDDSGVLKAFGRMDGASMSSAEIAIDKAYTVVSTGFGASTSELYDVVKDDPALVAGLASRG